MSMGAAADSIGVGLVGYGLAGRIFHKLLIDATEGLHLAAITSRGEDKRQRAADENPDAAVVAGFDDLLAVPEVELVVLATPHHVHAEQAVAALRAGKHVVTDKIMCRSVAEADAMIAAAARADRVLSVFHNRRWDSDFLTVQAALDAGWLGDVWSVDIAVTRSRMPLTPISGPPSWRATEAAFGGQLVDWGAHLMDQAVLLGGSEPDQVFCNLQHHWPGAETDSEGFVALAYPSGLRITITASIQTWLDKPHWRINGSDGGLVIEGIDPQEDLLKARDRDASGAPEAALPEAAVQVRSRHEGVELKPVPGYWRGYYENVRDALRGEADLAVTAEQARDVLRVYERCFRVAGAVNATTHSRPAGWLA